MPRRIAVVTSATGAALRDVLHILARRFPPAAVLIHPVPVQGVAAAPAIRAALDEASDRADCDVVILARGGGSLEDLWCFNDEGVARAIRRCTLPVVTGIGHETDFTIADFVADARAPTPSGAAQLVVPDRFALGQQLATLLGRLRLATQRQITHGLQRHDALAHRLHRTHPGSRLAQQAQRLDELEQRLAQATSRELATRRRAFEVVAARLQRVQPSIAMSRLGERVEGLEQRLRAALQASMSQATQRLALAARALSAVSPLAVLDRGYAIATTAAGEAIRDAAQLATGQTLALRFAQGTAHAAVIDVTPGQKKGA